MKTIISRICFGMIFLYLGVMVWALLTILVGPKFTVAYGVVGVIVACQYQHVDAWLVRKAVQGVK